MFKLRAEEDFRAAKVEFGEKDKRIEELESLLLVRESSINLANRDRVLNRLRCAACGTSRQAFE